MKVDLRFLCAVLITVVKCDTIKRSHELVSDLERLEALGNEPSQISKRDVLGNYPSTDDIQLNLEKRSRLDRMPAIFGKRSRVESDQPDFEKRSRLNRMPAYFGKRSRLNRMPAVFGKRTTLQRMPSYFGKRSRLNRMPAVFGKRGSSLERMPMVFGKRDLGESDQLDLDDGISASDFLSELSSGKKLTVEDLASIVQDNNYLLVSLISQLMDTNGDGVISLEELHAVEGRPM